jgi:hypothetical protein
VSGWRTNRNRPITWPGNSKARRELKLKDEPQKQRLFAFLHAVQGCECGEAEGEPVVQ